MNFDLPPVGSAAEPLATPARPGSSPAGGFDAALADAVQATGIPATPPPGVLSQMADAARIADVLEAQGRELHFEALGNGRVSAELRDANGGVLRSLSPSEALDIATGARKV